MDLMDFANVEFYAGRPDEASAKRLAWNGNDYSMSVEFDSQGALVATMTSGNCEWKTSLEGASFKLGVNMALEDACRLGQIVNYSADPER